MSKSNCYFRRHHYFGPKDKSGYHYYTTECNCRDKHEIGELNLAGKNYLYKNKEGKIIVGYHTFTNDGEENPLYKKIAKIQYDVFKKIFKGDTSFLATKPFYEKVDELVGEKI